MKIPGWYVDAMEQNLGQLMVMQSQKDLSVEQLVEMFMDRSLRGEDTVLSEEDHRVTLAICVSILLRRLARVDMPA